MRAFLFFLGIFFCPPRPKGSAWDWKNKKNELVGLQSPAACAMRAGGDARWSNPSGCYHAHRELCRRYEELPLRDQSTQKVIHHLFNAVSTGSTDYTPGRDGTPNAARRLGSGGRPRGCGFEEQGGACARIQRGVCRVYRGGLSPIATLSVCPSVRRILNCIFYMGGI